MGRAPRIIIPDIPHHIIQRGNRRQQVFFDDQDYRVYAKILAGRLEMHGVDLWAYCLMPNHVHLIAVPKRAEAMSIAIGEAHQRYAVYVNKKMEWKGHLWQDRFTSFAMDEPYLIAATRYVERNPVRAGLAKHPADWLWSSANAHLTGCDDVLVTSAPLLDLVDDCRVFCQRRWRKNNWTSSEPIAARANPRAAIFLSRWLKITSLDDRYKN